MDETDDDMLWNDSEEDWNFKSECEGGDSDTDNGAYILTYCVY
jgi:hypothetical protein